MLFHVVARGDTLWSISRKYGLPNWPMLYKYGANDQFRETRPDPNLIYPGDIIYIPTPGKPRPIRDRVQIVEMDPVSITVQVPQKKDPKTPTLQEAKHMSPAEAKKRELTFSAMVDLMAQVLGSRRLGLDMFLEIFKDGKYDKYAKGADGLQALCEFYQAIGLFMEGKKREGFGKLLRAFGAAFDALPDEVGMKIVRSVARSFRSIKKLKPIGAICYDLADIGAFGELMSFLGCMLEGDRDELCRSGDKLVGRLKRHPDVAAKTVKPLLEFLVGCLPNKLKVKLGTKMIGRKVPVVGTVIVGIFDVVDIASEPTDWKRWTGLGSTIVGLVPGVGTAGSALLDVAILVGTLADEIDNIDFAIT